MGRTVKDLEDALTSLAISGTGQEGHKSLRIDQTFVLRSPPLLCLLQDIYHLAVQGRLAGRTSSMEKGRPHDLRVRSRPRRHMQDQRGRVQ